MLGLPGTGKSTYLAALYHHLLQSERGSLRADQLSADQAYLNELRNAWLKCQELGRTNAASQGEARMSVSGPGVSPGLLILPDIAGDVIFASLKQRSWSVDFDGYIAGCAGALLFVSPLTTTEPAWIGEVGPHDSGADIKDGPPQAEDKAAAWSVEHCPTQVQVVDLLQNMLFRRGHAESLPLSLIVSAWDLLDGEYVEPGEWVRERLPLLDQYLSTNRARLPSRAFGVSAQGGELPKDAAKLADIDPEARPRVVVGITRGDTATGSDPPETPDIAAPIQFLLTGTLET